jgi:hypothetical protein
LEVKENNWQNNTHISENGLIQAPSILSTYHNRTGALHNID